MKLILSTSYVIYSCGQSITDGYRNVMSGGPSVIRRPFFEKSNTELTSSLRANFTAHQQSAVKDSTKSSYKAWTTQNDSALSVPTHTPSPLSEPRESYDITVKLFYLPNIPADRRCAQTREAIELVLKELGASSIDLLIVSFPGISFDADDEDSDFEDPPSAPQSTSENDGGCMDAEVPPEDIETMITTWWTLEKLQEESLVSKLGIAEFGVTRLSKFLEQTKIKPSVNQINVRDCCVVPKPLIIYAKQQKIELLTHNDCTNILPRGTLRQILGAGDNGSGVLAGEGNEAGLKGDVEPQWVVKYTAVVKDRGVVENKGYFAVAELKE
jgi:glutamate--cysteine ligase regulatory subunit